MSFIIDLLSIFGHGQTVPCPKCGTNMEYDEDGEYYICPDCGCEITDDDIEDGTYEYTYDATINGENYSKSDDYDIPEGCVACGNPDYPKCCDACPLFDD